MKFTAASAIIVSILAATSFATPTDFSDTSPRDLAAQAEGCGAAGSCHGGGGGDLCNDRVRTPILLKQFQYADVWWLVQEMLRRHRPV